MQLEKVITMANAPVRLRFLAMERSLRAAGWDGPLWVIPYDERRFPLPKNAAWWEPAEPFRWLAGHRAHPTLRKYACLLEGNYQFVDADVIFLENPAAALAPHDGFVTSCGHWHNPDRTVSVESRALLAAESTVWQSKVFNVGQFASERALYDLPGLRTAAENPDAAETILRYPYLEQPGLNLLVARAGAPVTNLTLPPHGMESTWAGDYRDADYARYWRAPRRRPYLLHWAGTRMDEPRPIHEEFLRYLTAAERAEWDGNVELDRMEKQRQLRSLRGRARQLRETVRVMLDH